MPPRAVVSSAYLAKVPPREWLIPCAKEWGMAEKDPVTGYEFTDSEVTQIDEGNPRSGTKFRHDGKWYYFKSISERQKFIGTPMHIWVVVRAARAETTDRRLSPART